MALRDCLDAPFHRAPLNKMQQQNNNLINETPLNHANQLKKEKKKNFTRFIQQ